MRGAPNECQRCCRCCAFHLWPLLTRRLTAAGGAGSASGATDASPSCAQTVSFTASAFRLLSDDALGEIGQRIESDAALVAFASICHVLWDVDQAGARLSEVQDGPRVLHPALHRKVRSCRDERIHELQNKVQVDDIIAALRGSPDWRQHQLGHPEARLIGSIYLYELRGEAHEAAPRVEGRNWRGEMGPLPISQLMGEVPGGMTIDLSFRPVGPVSATLIAGLLIFNSTTTAIK